MNKILTIAGSDPSGGAGIQADLKAFSALGTYGMAILSALTAQSTQGVDGVLPVPTEFIEKQYCVLYDDIIADAVKMGALVNSDIIECVAGLLTRYPIPFVVLDTVMIAKGGHPLLANDAVSAIRTHLLPLADIITPNIPEAAALLDTDEATTEAQMQAQGEALLALGPKAVLIKGGHLEAEISPDLLVTQSGTERLVSPRIATKNTHGTGCTLSAAIAALYPSHGLVNGVRLAKEYIDGAIAKADSLQVGQGIGPTHHFYRWW
ncbi:bifunctional hydroxymethylpyrimidine kinase/phosphomethylpyrimidine kinase [Ignatzschineria ureiclastica]|uniref:hydroxymethylpyrimidine kinase n=1 Tax=Ignatzschineria ureiclastica TaxID=472582 RepID=A0A2U2ADP4_9GAMM|nr:bifunctional hydroxymethylpyrimidine kinase/phosphomethylpyrimidine kinase [Ignatzschineria ureiclastica]PWD80778.1 bifunctional hydroxymethylpyrimidine kinase/phosphomethylpyrimidine kinase [Ignatzschineria ureiclastica]GGZ94737.1 hydroxymethylpyrimidine/phosphomethylpyrimidine kinase [Ignatzschineria ureiclastica]